MLFPSCLLVSSNLITASELNTYLLNLVEFMLLDSAVTAITQRLKL